MPEPDAAEIFSCALKILGSDNHPTIHEGLIARHLKRLASDREEFLQLCSGYEGKNKNKRVTEAIANNKAYDRLMKKWREKGILDEEDHDNLDDLEDYFDLHFPNRGQYLAKCLARERELGFLDPSKEQLELAAERKEAKRIEDLEKHRKKVRESFVHKYIYDFMKSYVPVRDTCAQPTKNWYTADSSLAVAEIKRNLKRSAEDRAASVAGFASGLQVRKQQRLAAAAADEAPPTAAWDSEEVSVEIRNAYYQSRFEKEQASRQAAHPDESNEEDFFEYEVMSARLNGNDFEPNPEVTNHGAPKRRRVAAA